MKLRVEHLFLRKQTAAKQSQRSIDEFHARAPEALQIYEADEGDGEDLA
jgi:hypothetical protein